MAGGCADAAEVAGVATQQDVSQLRTELAQAQQAAQRTKSDIDDLAGRIDRRARAEAERQTKALTERLDGLAASLAALASRVDDLAASVETLGRQLRAAAAPARPAPAPAPPAPAAPPAAPAPSSPGPAPSPAGPAPSSPAPAPPSAATAVPTRPTTGALQPQDIYQAAYIDFSRGSYSLAIAGFREFLRRYPDHELGGNAQYWIGEAYLSLARASASSGQADKAADALNQAVLEFRKVLANYPRAEKVPTALYKEALALIELRQPQVAQQRLQYLLDNFPQAEEASLARERLAALKK